jgi:transposase-like protein
MGILLGNQRYYCKDCKKTFREMKDRRIKYSDEKRIKVMKMYLEGIGIRSIERLEGISNVLILKWIKNFGKTIKEKIIEEANNIPNDIKKGDIEVLEGDEIVTYIKKNSKMEGNRSGYGFLLTETGIKLLIFK